MEKAKSWCADGQHYWPHSTAPKCECGRRELVKEREYRYGREGWGKVINVHTYDDGR